MSFLDRFQRKKVKLKNREPNEIQNVGVDDLLLSHQQYRDSHDWIEYSPPKIKPTIKNCRKASQFPTVYGIINNLIMKAISSFIIEGDDKESVDHIKMKLAILGATGAVGMQMIKCIEERKIDCDLRLLAFDGEKALIKKIYDENAQLCGYKQLVVRKKSIKKWKGIDFWETFQDQDVITVDFEVEQISNPQLISIDGNGVSLVKNVIDIAYYIESLARMMPPIVFKSANVMVATIGNENRKETKMDNKARDYIAEELSDYSKKGVITIPYGIDLELVGDNVLPKIQDYIKSLKSMLFEGLITPESLYSSESSNRSTAEIQLTDTRTGHVLFIEFCQEFLKEWLERDLINPELQRIGKKEGSAYISFMTGDKDLDTNYLEEGNKVGEELDGETVSND